MKRETTAEFISGIFKRLEEKDKTLRATKEGKLYRTTKDFWAQEEIQKQIPKIMKLKDPVKIHIVTINDEESTVVDSAFRLLDAAQDRVRELEQRVDKARTTPCPIKGLDEFSYEVDESDLSPEDKKKYYTWWQEWAEWEDKKIFIETVELK